MTADAKGPLPPGSVIGMLGGGQLGRMTALAAAELGYRTHVYTPELDAPCAQVADRATTASFGDSLAMDRFVESVDVVTFEFENIPIDAVTAIADRVPVRPDPKALAVCQDRLAEKVFINSHGASTAPFRAVPDPAILPAMVDEIGTPCVLKANRLGYDGKGQTLLRSRLDAADAWRRVGGAMAILEGWIDFTAEISVVAARSADGAVLCYPPVENQHENHILKRTLAPARIDRTVAERAETIASRLIDSLGVVGILAVEMFVERTGDVLVNELAPRPHNSGHWTIDACGTSQFTQFVRAVVGLPLAPIDRHADAEMINLLGDDVSAWQDWATEPRAHLHLYGKGSARPGRKMGHVTRLLPLGTVA